MGTFRALIGTIGSVSINSWTADPPGTVHPSALADILTALRTAPYSVDRIYYDGVVAVPFESQVQAFIDQWSLDDASPVDFNNLPAGFSVVSASIELKVLSNGVLGDPTYQLTSTAMADGPVETAVAGEILSLDYPTGISAIQIFTD